MEDIAIEEENEVHQTTRSMGRLSAFTIPEDKPVMTTTKDSDQTTTLKSRPWMVHTVSIIVDLVDPGDMRDKDVAMCVGDKAGDIPLKEDYVQTFMDHARLRKEEFARLLEEYAQIVQEINKAENVMM